MDNEVKKRRKAVFADPKRQIFTNTFMCSCGKKSFPTRTAANKAADIFKAHRSYDKSKPGYFRAYYCSVGDCYHIGHGDTRKPTNEKPQAQPQAQPQAPVRLQEPTIKEFKLNSNRTRLLQR